MPRNFKPLCLFMIFVVVFIPTSPTFGESSDPLKQLVLFLETMSDVTVSPGEIFYVTLRVINNSEFTAKDLYIDFYTRSVGSKKPFSFAEGQQPSIEKGSLSNGVGEYFK